MRIKKILSVFLAAVMLFGALSVGFVGAAAEVDYEAQYRWLAEALQNEYVRELTNYTLTNATLSNETGGFDVEAKGFAYDHKVVARDNENGDILKASNRFYYIAENLMSYKYGVGCYDPSTLISYISEKIKPHFDTGSDSKIYEDFYGDRFYPSAEQIVAYENAVNDILANGLTINQATLTERGIYFSQVDEWTYYNVDAILKYFVGNVMKINTGNWYHRFSFVVETSVNNILEDCLGVDYLDSSAPIILRTAVYQVSYQKEYNESMSKSYYSFAPPSLDLVWQNYATEYGLDKKSADLTGYEEPCENGQASGFLIKQTEDRTTIPFLISARDAFDKYIQSDKEGVKWDEKFVSLTDKQIDNKNDGVVDDVADYRYEPVDDSDYYSYENENGKFRYGILSYARELTSRYSNDALKAVFGARLGNMVTLAYLMKTSYPDAFSVEDYASKEAAMADTANPSRIVRGDAPYIATADKLNDIIHDIDALVSPNANETDDVKISNRVAQVLSMFLDVGGLLGIEDEIDYSTLEDLIGKVLQQLVFSNSIINLLVEMLYPMIVNLLEETVGHLTGYEGLDNTISGILNDVIDDNDLAVYPHELGSRIASDYKNPDGTEIYPIATSILKNAKDNRWENVNFELVDWGVDKAPAAQKSEAFLNALCAGLGGFTRVLVCFLLGDYEYNLNILDDELGIDSVKDANGNKIGNIKNYYDLKLLDALSIWVVSQGLYTKLFVPLYRVLGLSENEYLSSRDYHISVANNVNTCLREAVRPIITWVTDHVAKRPIETVMRLVPNLVHFLSRQGSGLSSYSEHWAKPSFVNVVGETDQQKAHKYFSTVQTYNLWTIMENVHINLIGIINVRLWGSSIAEFLKKQSGMLSSLNALLNEVISFTYETDQVDKVYPACYYNDAGEIAPHDSYEYATNSSNYPNPKDYYYSNEDNTSFSFVQDEEHPYYHDNVTYVEKPFYIPAVPEAKLISCGVVDQTTNTIVVDNPGLVFKFLLRYVISALGYRYTSEVTEVNGELVPVVPTVIECLGIDLKDELFMGLTFETIIDNVMIHPDEAICALLELFYSNEEGDLYKKGKNSYTYPVTPIDYHEDVLLNRDINPTLSYGADIKYSQYWTKEYANDFVSSLGPLAEDVLIMLGIEGMEDGLGPFLENLLNENVFTNDLVNTVFNAVYQLIAGLNDSLGIDLEGILLAVLDVDFSPYNVGNTLKHMMGFDTEASATIMEADTWMDIFGAYETDPETGEEVLVMQDVDLDWGLKVVDEEAGTALCEQNNMSRADAFLRNLSALFSPAAFLLKFLFMDEDLSVLGLINLNSYPGYQYAFIGLLEALSCPDVLTYNEYYEAAQDKNCGDANVVYHLFSPLLGLLENVYASPVDTILNMLPNLLFFISVGGLSDFVNNLIHFAYVLLDILRPIIDGYDLLSGLLANIDISGLSLNLTLPLDIDVNSLISDILGTLVGDVLTIEGVQIQLPYIDLYSLCVGTLQPFLSAEDREIAHLNPAGGGELLTALLRIVFEVLFMEENHKALTQIISNLAGEGKLDAYDEETLYMVVNGLIGLIEEYEVLDMVLMVVYMLISKLVPIADTLAPRFQANNMTITDLIDSASDTDAFVANISLLLKDPNEVEAPDTTTDVNAMTSLLDRLLAFFEKIKLFFQQLFNFG